MSMVTAVTIAGFVIVITFVIVRARLNRPGRKWIGKARATVFSNGHFGVIQKAGIELCFESVRVQINSKKSDGLAPIAEKFLPLLSGSLRHLNLARMFIANGPPLPGGGNMGFGAGQIEATDETHSRGKPEKTLRPKNSGKAALQ